MPDYGPTILLCILLGGGGREGSARLQLLARKIMDIFLADTAKWENDGPIKFFIHILL